MNDKFSEISWVNFAFRIQASLVRRAVRFFQGGSCYCICCGRKSSIFLPYYRGIKSAPPVTVKLDFIGSDLENYSCAKCESNDRERHLHLYCSRLNINESFCAARVLHFAPERWFSRYVVASKPSQYIKADLFPSALDVQRVDMLDMEFQDGSFDVVIANHVLEHVSDDARALSEIHRVLRPGGFAILQTPYSGMLQETFEDDGIVSSEAREYVYGQGDHVRLYGQDIFSRFAAAGFIQRIAKHENFLANIDPAVYGVNFREPFFLFERR